jgi:hypothetical protein
MVFGSDGMRTDADGGNGLAILPADTLKNTDQKFVFEINQGISFATTLADCGSIPYVQLGDEATLAPGVARDHSHGELYSDYTRH